MTISGIVEDDVRLQDSLRRQSCEDAPVLAPNRSKKFQLYIHTTEMCEHSNQIADYVFNRNLCTTTW